jgi:outer membrane cobalamin receptor
VDGVVKYTFPWSTSLRAAVTWAGGTVVYSRNEPLRSLTLDDFVLLDFRLEQPFWEDHLRLYVGVDNVLDEEWTYNYGDPQPGRMVYGGFELRYF